jgi:two-component system, OmpR family, response regulator ChvI
MEGISNHDDTSKINDIGLSEVDILPQEIYFRKQNPTDYYCICFVDMVGSTRIIAEIVDSDKIGKYYSMFLNAMAAIVKNFGAKVIKSVGDALIFYFPDTSNSNNEIAFKEVLECFTGIIVARDLINSRLSLERLPDVSYRISADYGRVEVGTAVTSGAEDLFGPTLSICAKMNPKAERNGIIIGGDLYQVIKRFSFEAEYEFKEVEGGCPIGLKQSYPLFSVIRREKNASLHGSFVSAIFKRSASTPKVPSAPPADDMIQIQRPPHTVMLVDDEPDVVAVFKSFLLQDGYCVEAFSDSYRALQAFARSESHHFDLVILDIRMPSMNGLQLYRRLKAIDPYIKVIFLTALEATEELVSVLDGVTSVDVMKKPIDRKHFLQRIRASIQGLSDVGNTNAS